MVVIWGSNFSAVKVALRDFPELSFNALRLALASVVFLVAIAWQRRPETPRLNQAEWRRIAVLGGVGHLLYQLCFLGGVARTSVANSSLMLGCSPVIIAILASVAGHERLRRTQWIGAALSLAGIYVLVGRRATWSMATLSGDLLMLASVICWSLYSVAAQPLLRRHSPLIITGWSMVTGTVLYVVMAVPALRATDWLAISARSWALMAGSSILALAFAYIVWYTGVQRIGSSRTALYSNLTPIVAMVVAVVWLGERTGGVQIMGAILILSGLAVARIASE